MNKQIYIMSWLKHGTGNVYVTVDFICIILVELQGA